MLEASAVRCYPLNVRYDRELDDGDEDERDERADEGEVDDRRAPVPVPPPRPHVSRP